jgi:hypothetical protein
MAWIRGCGRLFVERIAACELNVVGGDGAVGDPTQERSNLGDGLPRAALGRGHLHDQGAAVRSSDEQCFGRRRDARQSNGSIEPAAASVQEVQGPLRFDGQAFGRRSAISDTAPERVTQGPPGVSTTLPDPP